MTVVELKSLLEAQNDTQPVLFEIHENGNSSNVSYSVDLGISKNGFFILISED